MKTVKITEETHELLTLIQLVEGKPFPEILERLIQQEFQQRHKEIQRYLDEKRQEHVPKQQE